MARAKDYPGFEKLGTDQLSARCYSKTSAEHLRIIALSIKTAPGSACW